MDRARPDATISAGASDETLVAAAIGYMTTMLEETATAMLRRVMRSSRRLRSTRPSSTKAGTTDSVEMSMAVSTPCWIASNTEGKDTSSNTTGEPAGWARMYERSACMTPTTGSHRVSLPTHAASIRLPWHSSTWMRERVVSPCLLNNCGCAASWITSSRRSCSGRSCVPACERASPTSK
eukprot:scaffold25065_cov129-Isochrysis_galbana.AAC.3